MPAELGRIPPGCGYMRGPPRYASVAVHKAQLAYSAEAAAPAAKAGPR